MRANNDPLVRFVSGIVLPAIEEHAVELDSEIAEDGFTTILRLPATDDELYRIVSSVLDPTVWWRAERTPASKPRSARTRADWLPRWSGLSDIGRDDVPRLLRAWRRATSRRGVPDFIRLSVNPYERSDLLKLAARLGQPVVPSVRWLSGVAFTWHYPVRVTAAGSSRDRLLKELRDLPRSGSDFVVSDDRPDVCFVSGYHDEPELSSGTVMAIGRRDAHRLFSSAIWNGNSTHGVAVAAGVPRTELSWWPEVVAALTRNIPLDCALASVVPGSCVGGISAALTATTLDYEAAGWHASPTSTRFVGSGTLPDMEGEGSELGKWVPASPRQAGAEDLDAPGATKEDPRRLVVSFRDGAKNVRAVLPPHRELSLEVAVRVPKRGRLAADHPVVVSHPDEPVVILDVVAHSVSWSEPQRSQVAFSIDDYDHDSTSAVFTVVTDGPGALVITIDLLHRGRVIHQADVVAAVRETALAGERIRVEARKTSASAASSAIPAAIWLDATGSELRNIRTGAVTPLAPLDGILEAFELQASRILGDDEAPETLTDVRARALLIDLARRGAGLRDQLACLGLEQSPGKVVSLLVHEQTRVLPLELVYDGDAPARGARLCQHVKTPPPSGRGCDQTSSRVVCPYAFWSLSRTIVRTVVLPNDRSLRPPHVLRLRPVIFAASDLADRGTPSHLRPSDALQQACIDLFGDVKRVRSWTAWRRHVRSVRPELMVLLAHTQLNVGEAALQIGTNSFLARPEIGVPMVGDSPLVLLIACASAVVGDEFGTLASTLTARGAAAVVGTLTKLSGDHGSRAAVAVLGAVCSTSPGSLSSALALARRELVAQGLLVGMLLVAHGEVDFAVETGDAP